MIRIFFAKSVILIFYLFFPLSDRPYMHKICKIKSKNELFIFSIYLFLPTDRLYFGSLLGPETNYFLRLPLYGKILEKGAISVIPGRTQTRIS